MPTASAESSAVSGVTEIIPDGTPTTDLPDTGAIGTAAPFFAVISALGLAALAVTGRKHK